MKISLIENGLDSLKKGYGHLAEYERLAGESAADSLRFSALKDSVLCIQHGIEILFKYRLEKEHELLLYSDISTKLKSAFKKRRDGEIFQLYEAEGVHTVTYKESIERLKDICGLPIEKKFHDTLLQVEGWRNRITHSGVLLRENEVSKTLMTLLTELDNFFGSAIGAEYLKGQGRTELDRAYTLTKAVYGALENQVKALTVERLIEVLKANNIKNVSAPDTFIIEDARTAFAVLQQMQGKGIKYGCDLINGHCSGSASVTKLSENGILTIYTEDNRTSYELKLQAIVVMVPNIKNNQSPLVFIYSEAVAPAGREPVIRKDEDDDYRLQYGISFNASGEESWEKSDYDQSSKDWDSDEPVLLPHQSIIRFISEGPVCFMNVQELEYGSASNLLGKRDVKSPHRLYQLFKDHLAEKSAS